VLFPSRPLASHLEIIWYLNSSSKVSSSILALIWTALKQEAVQWPISPPFGLKILWFESNLKMLSIGHKKSQPNYTHEELLTTKTRDKNTLLSKFWQPGTRGGF